MSATEDKMEDIRELEKKLHGVIVRKKLIAILAGLAALVTAGAAAAILLSALAAVLIIPAPVKFSILILILILALYACYRYLYKPIKSTSGVIGAALGIEKKHPELKGRLVAALQFRDLDIERMNFSPALINLTARQALDLTAGINFNEIVSGYPLWRRLRSAAIVAIIFTVLAFMVPGFFSNALAVYSQPLKTIAPPPGFEMQVFPVEDDQIKYSDIKIGGALLGGGFPEEVKIAYRFAGGRWQTEDIDLSRSTSYRRQDSMVFNPGDSLPFALTLKQVRRSFDFYVMAGKRHSETFAVNVVERPRVTGLKVTVDYPSYSRQESLILDEDNGTFAALMGSRIGMDIEANRDIAEGYLVSGDSVRSRIDFTGSHGNISFVLTEDLIYHIRLLDKNGEENPDPIEYVITAIPDEFPVIEVLFPGFDLNLDDNLIIPFRLKISDDYGFSSLILKYEIISGGSKNGENVAIINYPATIETEGEVSFNWDLLGFDLLPSDYVLYHFEIADNDRVSGPKISRTRTYAARLPSIDEIVHQAEKEQENYTSQSERILKEQKEMAEKLDRLVEQMQSDKNLEWKNKKELENLLQKQEEATEQLEQLAENLKKSLDQAEKNNLLSQQIMEKMRELQKLFEEVATPEMREAMQKLQDALENMSPEELEEAMKEFQLSQEDMLEKLERTLDLFKQMRLEQKMAAMLKMAEEILLEQNRVNVDTEEALKPENKNTLAQRESQLRDMMGALKKEASALNDLMGDTAITAFPEQEEFVKAVEENEAPADMQAMENQLGAMQKDEALESGREASSKLSGLVQKMQDLMTRMTSRQGKELLEFFRRAIADANYLSEEQEGLFEQAARLQYERHDLNKIAVEQQILREAALGLENRLQELGRQSPFVAAEVTSTLRQCQEAMKNALDRLSDTRSSRLAADLQRTALEKLNRAALQLYDGMNEQKDCNNGSCCNSSNPKMQSLCQKQNKINMETQSTCNKPGQKLSDAQRERLQQLAAEQGTVRKTLGELQNEFGNRREILGRIDAISDEMKDIEEMLEDGQTGPELFDRQLRIYSRMLDMQKSLSRRDFTRERIATSAEDIWRASPGPLEDDGDILQQSFQNRLNEYLREGYPRQYEQQIKAYFKAISNMNQEPDENE